MKKSILSLILAISTVLSLFSINVYAKAPGVETLSAIDIETDSVVMRGMVTSNSGIKIKEYGFEFENDGNISWKKFYSGKDFNYPDPINNDIIECKKTGLKPDTEYSYRFYAINENGEKTFGKGYEFETEGDNKDPEITKLKCSEGSSFEEGTEVTFSASAKDDQEVKTISLFLDGELLLKTNDSSISYTTDELEPGTYEIAASARDRAGNESDPKFLTITVKAKPIHQCSYENYYDHTEYEQIAGNDSYHNAVKYYNKECEDCGKTIQTDIKGESAKELHRFSGNICTVCDYEKFEEIPETPQQGNGVKNEDNSWGNTKDEEVVESHTHIPTDYYQTTKYEIISGDDTYHRAVPYYNTQCATCYEMLKTNVRGESTKEKHVFYYNECGLCGYEKEEIVVATPAPAPKNETSISDFHEKAYNNASSYGGIKVYVNGSKLYFDVEPEIKNGRTMVPLRAIFEALGAEVEWNGATSTVYAYRGNESVELTIGSYYLYTSSGVTTLDQPGYITNGRTLVPVRAISEAFNCDVQWYQEKQLVSIVAKDRKYQTVVSTDYPAAEIGGSNYTQKEQEVYDTLTLMMNGSLYNNVYKTGTVYSGPRYDEECKGFARTVHNKLFKYDIGSTKSNDYEINILNQNSKLIGQVTTNNTDAYKKIFTNARPGDFVQMSRQNENTTPHSAIVYYVNENGVAFYEANTDGKNGIKQQFYTWKELNDKNDSMSVYTAVNY